MRFESFSSPDNGSSVPSGNMNTNHATGPNPSNVREETVNGFVVTLKNAVFSLFVVKIAPFSSPIIRYHHYVIMID